MGENNFVENLAQNFNLAMYGVLFLAISFILSLYYILDQLF